MKNALKNGYNNTDIFPNISYFCQIFFIVNLILRW